MIIKVDLQCRAKNMLLNYKRLCVNFTSTPSSEEHTRTRLGKRCIVVGCWKRGATRHDPARQCTQTAGALHHELERKGQEPSVNQYQNHWSLLNIGTLWTSPVDPVQLCICAGSSSSPQLATAFIRAICLCGIRPPASQEADGSPAYLRPEAASQPVRFNMNPFSGV